jgi:hypothetical protein
MTQREQYIATIPVSEHEYDSFVAELETGLRRQYPNWQWDFVRYNDLVPSEAPAGYLTWVRFRASLFNPADVVAVHAKRWMLLGEPVAHLVVAIGEQMEFERSEILRRWKRSGA